MDFAKHQTSYAYGIDLGTISSCISYLKDGKLQMCQSIEGENKIPLVVRMPTGEMELVVGRKAKDLNVLYLDYTLCFNKSLVGKHMYLKYGSDENVKGTISHEDILVEILKKLARDAERFTNSEVQDVVIAVPTCFGDMEREETRKAGVLAGLNIIDIIDESVAALLFYECEEKIYQIKLYVFLIWEAIH